MSPSSSAWQLENALHNLENAWAIDYTALFSWQWDQRLYMVLAQVIYSGPMTSSRAKKLQRLSADTISNITLAGHCVKVRAVSDLS